MWHHATTPHAPAAIRSSSSDRCHSSHKASMSLGRCETQSSPAHAGRRSSCIETRDFNRRGRARRSISQTSAAKVASSGPEPADRDRTAPVPQTVSGRCRSDTAQPKTRGCSEHSPGNEALRCMRPILHPRAACVVGHRAKDELTTAGGGRQARATALLPPPFAVRPVQTVVVTRTAANGSMMSGSALRHRSNPTRWPSGRGRGSECFARKRQWVQKPLTSRDKRFRPRCAAGPAIPMATEQARATRPVSGESQDRERRRLVALLFA